MNKILNSTDQNLPEEFYILSKSIPKFILNPYSQREFSKLVNDYKAKKGDSTLSFEIMCNPKSEILKMTNFEHIKNFTIEER